MKNNLQVGVRAIVDKQFTGRFEGHIMTNYVPVDVWTIA